MRRSQQNVTFRRTDNPLYPYEAVVDNERWTVRVNEFPEEPSLYSLLIDDQVVEELMAWPAAWTRPTAAAPARSPTKASGDDDPLEKATRDREQAPFERTHRVPPSKLVK